MSAVGAMAIRSGKLTVRYATMKEDQGGVPGAKLVRREGIEPSTY